MGTEQSMEKEKTILMRRNSVYFGDVAAAGVSLLTHGVPAQRSIKFRMKNYLPVKSRLSHFRSVVILSAVH